MKKCIMLTIIWGIICVVLVSPWVDIIVTNHRNAANAEHEFNLLKQCELRHKNDSEIKDSLFNTWVITHDTTLRHVVKIVKTPNWSCYGYWKRTGRLECEPTSNGRMICQPESTYIETNECYVSYYTKDTVWSNGYTSHEHWVSEATSAVNDTMTKAVFHLCAAQYPYWNGNKFNGPYKGVWAQITGMTLKDSMSNASILGWIWVFLWGFGWLIVVLATIPILERIWRKKSRTNG